MFSSWGLIGFMGGFKFDAFVMWMLSKWEILEYNKKADDSEQLFLSALRSPYSHAHDVNFPLNRQISWQPPLLMLQGLVPEKKNIDNNFWHSIGFPKLRFCSYFSLNFQYKSKMSQWEVFSKYTYWNSLVELSKKDNILEAIIIIGVAVWS